MLTILSSPSAERVEQLGDGSPHGIDPGHVMAPLRG
jgi:hypothetical protein